MSISKQELYGVFLKNFNNSLVRWDLLPLDEVSSLEKKEDSKDKVSVPITEEAVMEKNSKDKSVSKKVSLEVLFKYDKDKGNVYLVGNQISSVLGYPSSSLYFKLKDMKDINKVNSSYQFMVKDSFYQWTLTLSSSAIKQKEELNENNTDIQQNKFTKT